MNMCTMRVGAGSRECMSVNVSVDVQGGNGCSRRSFHFSAHLLPSSPQHMRKTKNRAWVPKTRTDVIS